MPFQFLCTSAFPYLARENKVFVDHQTKSNSEILGFSMIYLVNFQTILFERNRISSRNFDIPGKS